MNGVFFYRTVIIPSSSTEKLGDAELRFYRALLFGFASFSKSIEIFTIVIFI